MMKLTNPACSSPASSRFMAAQRQRLSGATVKNSSEQRAGNGPAILASSPSSSWKPSSTSSRTGSPGMIAALPGRTFPRSSRWQQSQKHMPRTVSSQRVCQSRIGEKKSAGALASSPVKPSRPSLRAAPASSKKGPPAVPKKLQDERSLKAAHDYMTGVSIRQQQLQLTDRMLAKKFECSPSVIKRIRAHGVVTALSEEDQQLVRRCAREHDQLESRAAYFTKPYLSAHYGIPICAIDRALARLGFKNPLNRKAKAEEGEE